MWRDLPHTPVTFLVKYPPPPHPREVEEIDLSVGANDFLYGKHFEMSFVLSVSAMSNSTS